MCLVFVVWCLVFGAQVHVLEFGIYVKVRFSSFSLWAQAWCSLLDTFFPFSYDILWF